MSTERKNKSNSNSPTINDSQSTLNIRQRTFPSTSTSSTYPLGISFLSTSTTLNESEDMAYIEKRTAHNALERQRREGLNSKFQELAHVLPALQQIRRPSKSMIVSKSLEFVSKANERRTEYECQLDALRLENAQLLRQAEISTKRMKKQVETDNSSQKLKKQSIPKTSNQTKSISAVKSKNVSSRMKPQLRQSSLPINQPSSSSANSSPLKPNEEPQLSEPDNTSDIRNQKKRARDDFDSQDNDNNNNTISSSHIIEDTSQLPVAINKRRRRNYTTEINSNVMMNNIVDYRSGVDHTQPGQSSPHRGHNRYSSHQSFSSPTGIISPGPSRHNSLTSDQLNIPYSHHHDTTTTTTATIEHCENETLVVPSQFDIASTSSRSPFGNEHTYYNTYENFEHVVSTIPALRTPVGRNTHTTDTTNTNQPSYDPTLDIFNSLMHGQNSSSNNNSSYYWHP